MHPKLWEIPGLNLPIYSYGFMIMLGFLTAIFIATRRGKQAGISSETILDIGIIIMVSGVLGARIAYLSIYPGNFNWAIFNIFDGGLNTPAGIIGWFLPYAFFLWWRKRKSSSSSETPAKPDRPILTLAWLFVISLATAVLIARTVHLITHWTDYGRDAFRFFYIWEGGLVFYGGLTLAILSGLFYFHRKKLSVLKIADLLTPVAALGLAFGRIGCYLNGCCFGTIAPDLSWAVRFPNLHEIFTYGSPAFDHHLELGRVLPTDLTSLPIHPTQLYSCLAAIILFILLSLIWYKKKKDGLVLAGLMIGYPIARFCLEFFRGDNERIWLGLTVSQLISAVVFAAGLGFLYYLLKKKSEIGS